MYYYIFEQPKNKWVAALQNRIAGHLEELAVLGEVAKANPIQKPEELCQTGLSKGYTTIVAVGSDTMVNNLASIVARKEATLGIIPLDTKSSFWGLIGCQGWEEACHILPKRRVETFDMGKVGQGKYFLTFVKILSERETPKPLPTLMGLHFSGFKAEVPALEVTVTNGVLETAQSQIVRESFSDGLLDIFITTKLNKEEKTLLSFLFGKKTTKPTFSSLFHAKKVKILGEEEILKVCAPDNQIIAKTPIEISIIPQVIRIIISKASLKSP